jgi:transposase InsO family protein
MMPNTNIKKQAFELYSQGKSYREIAKYPDMPSKSTVWRWITDHEYDRQHANNRKERPQLSKKTTPVPIEGEGRAFDGFEGTLEEKIYQLELENDILRGLVELLKVPSPSQLNNREKSALIEWLRHNKNRRLNECIASLKIYKTSYDYWKKHLHDINIREKIAADVERIFREDGNCARGYRFVHTRLVEELGEPISEKIVRDVMRERGLVVVYKQKSKKLNTYKGEVDERPENLLYDKETGKHDFHADMPGQKLVTDITEFKLPDAPKIYLSLVMDLFDSKPLGWSVSLHPDAELANSSLIKAIKKVGEGDILVHSDCGIHYRTYSWKAICEEEGITRSMSRKGKSPDNAACEGFFGRLKNEFFYGRDWKGVGAEEFMKRLNEWIVFYSRERLKAFKENGRTIYDTIDGRRRRLGLAL